MKYPIWIYILLIFLLAWLAGSCSDSPVDNAQLTCPENYDGAVLMPLTVGNWWEYEVRFPSFENPEGPVFRETVIDQLTVDTDNDGEPLTAFVIDTDIETGAVPDHHFLYRNGKCGLYMMGGIAETDTLFQNELHYKFPAENGDGWTTPQLSFSRDEHRFYVSRTLEITLTEEAKIVEVPAGTFSANVYKFSYRPSFDVLEKLDYILFYSPNVGMIRQEERGQSDNRLITEMVLSDYHLE